MWTFKFLKRVINKNTQTAVIGVWPGDVVAKELTMANTKGEAITQRFHILLLYVRPPVGINAIRVVLHKRS